MIEDIDKLQKDLEKWTLRFDLPGGVNYTFVRCARAVKQLLAEIDRMERLDDMRDGFMYKPSIVANKIALDKAALQEENIKLQLIELGWRPPDEVCKWYPEPGVHPFTEEDVQGYMGCSDYHYWEDTYCPDCGRKVEVQKPTKQKFYANEKTCNIFITAQKNKS